MLVDCPYCGKRLGSITPSHLRLHGKTRLDLHNDFPDMKFYMQPKQKVERDYSEVDKYLMEKNFRNFGSKKYLNV